MGTNELTPSVKRSPDVLRWIRSNRSAVASMSASSSMGSPTIPYSFSPFRSGLFFSKKIYI